MARNATGTIDDDATVACGVLRLERQHRNLGARIERRDQRAQRCRFDKGRVRVHNQHVARMLLQRFACSEHGIGSASLLQLLVGGNGRRHARCLGTHGRLDRCCARPDNEGERGRACSLRG